ncbi:MAG: hypothetical protein RLZZ303_1293 [Candidatus Hydrogenedentota bacterium]
MVSIGVLTATAQEGEGEGAPPSVGECPPESMLSQPPAAPSDPEAAGYVSDVFRTRFRFERFSGLTAPIVAVRWWGGEASNPDNEECTRSAAIFGVRVFTDNAGAPGTITRQGNVLVTKTLAGTGQQGRPIYQYDYAVDPPLDQADGWISIVGISDAACSFFWYSSTEGNNAHLDQDGAVTPVSASGDLSLCLIAEEIPPLEGEGAIEGEGALEGEGAAEGEGAIEGEGEGVIEGEGEGTLEGEGAAEGEGSVEGEGASEGECLPEGENEGTEEGETFPPLDTCALDTLGGQRPLSLSHPEVGIYTSDETLTFDLRSDRFSGIASPIGGVRWWGVGFNQFFSNCDRTSAAFRIRFFEGGPSLPGAPVAEFVVNASRTPLGQFIAGREIYRHEAVFDTPVDLCNGWISITGIDDEECRFAWYRSDIGDDFHIREIQSGSTGATGDFAFCFLPVGYEIPEGEGLAEGEGAEEGEGVLEGEGVEEGVVEGIVEGIEEGEGAEEGVVEGVVEGTVDGEGSLEGEGSADGEGASEGEGEGAVEGSVEGSVEGVLEGEGEIIEVLEDCPAGVESSQPPAIATSPNAGFYGSDATLGDRRIERFSGANLPITGLRWWGTTIETEFFGGCLRTVNDFVVRFYEGNDLSLGALVSEQTVTASVAFTESIVQNRIVYRFRADLPQPVSLNSGWLSIEGTGDNTCLFYWYRSDFGNGEHLRVNDGSIGAGFDLSYCLLPDLPRAPGHSADQDGNFEITLDELLRGIQLFNGDGHQCAPASEDGYALGDDDRDCPPHASDYNPKDWRISLSELLRLIQLYSLGGFEECPESEDGFCITTS